MSDIVLSSDQQKIFKHYLDKQNIFITGFAGTGKSKILEIIIEDARKKNLNIAVCAMTGCASVLLGKGAKTLHSWAGIGLGKKPANQIVTKLLTKSHHKKHIDNWRNTDILIIDEVSMMSQHLFELLDTVGKRIRKNIFQPFGGLQLIFSGDFCQLPPIREESIPKSGNFCFESKLWKTIFRNTVLLNEVFRQKEPVLQNILLEMRQGKLSKKSIRILKKRKKACKKKKLKPTILLPKKDFVNKINKYEMKQLKKKTERVYHFKFIEPENLTISFQQLQIEKQMMINTSRFSPEIKLRLGAQVMCVANIDVENGICNGSRCIITNFKDGLPEVRFLNGTKMIIDRYPMQSENIRGLFINQIPLIPAWAITIHKSQGSSLDLVELDLGPGIFEYGQTYVAISRVRTIKGLYLYNFDPYRVFTHPKAIEFYKKLIDC